MRFPAVCLSSAAIGALALSPPAYAQSATSQAKVEDIQVSREGEKISILVKLSQQPTAASAKSTGEALTLEVGGLTLAPLSLSPPAGAMVTGVKTSSGTITLSGAALDHATTVIYRNAILIEAKYAEAKLNSGSSLMKAATPAPMTPPAQPTAPAPVTAAAAASQPVTPVATQPVPATPAPSKPTPIALMPPTSNAPIALPSPTAKPPQPANELQSHPAPPAPVTPVSLPTASIAGVDAARCTSAEAELKKDAWALAAMGDQALCLLDAGKYDEAKSKLDQLAAITPLDWRVSLGLAVLQDHKGEKDLAQAAWLAAVDRAPTDTVRAAIKARIDTASAKTS
ncbi:MAG: hypothetical protein QM773_15190 [Hyphomonadaceae bacterium]